MSGGDVIIALTFQRGGGVRLLGQVWKTRRKPYGEGGDGAVLRRGPADRARSAARGHKIFLT